MNEQRNKYWLPLVISFVLSLGLFVGMRIKEMTYNGNSQGGFSKINEVLGYIDAQYVSDVNEEKISKEAILGIVNNLDPHSNYLTREEVLEIAEHQRGHFDGIGVQFFINNDTILLSDILKGGPAEDVGLESGDKIITVNDSLMAGVGITSDGVIKLLKGSKGTEVNLTVKKIKDNSLENIKITRGVIPISSIDACYMLDEKTAYVKINRFNGDTFNEFMKGIEHLEDQNSNFEHLIIDVRNNPGGYLGECVKLINQLFDDDKALFVYTKGDKNKKQEYKSTGKPLYEFKNIAILINESSASASEILAGAIQDNDRGVILGRRSFGKGLVQQDFPLSDGSSLRLTVAKYYTPSGRCIQKDYEGHDHYEDLNKRLEDGELYSKDSIHLADSTVYKTLRGRTVYAGGGIIPDVYIPFDTVRYNEDFFSVRNQIVAFSFKNKYKGMAVFPQKFQEFVAFKVPADFYNKFEDYCRKQDPLIAKDYFISNRSEIENIIKSQYAQFIYDKSYFYRINNQTDTVVQEALKYIYKENPLGL